jgi:A/G-specific adenine glycosylase
MADIEDLFATHGPSFHQFSEAETAVIRTNLLQWFTATKRSLPWRGTPPPWNRAEVPTKAAKKGKGKAVDPTAAAAAEEVPVFEDPAILSSPYAIWVCEVMSQQTRIDTVLTYFLKWMQRFPTVHSLAAAETEEINSVWAG